MLGLSPTEWLDIDCIVLRRQEWEGRELASHEQRGVLMAINFPHGK